jgi:hypothetical protein
VGRQGTAQRPHLTTKLLQLEHLKALLLGSNTNILEHK